jgi:hypothetical protein
MRKTLKFLHTVAACGMVGAVLGYGLVLIGTGEDTPRAYADMRQTVSALANYLLLPSMGVALLTGFLAIAWHRPFHDLGWVWIKAALGLSVFEATLVTIQAKANRAGEVASRIVAGEAGPDELAAAITNEWAALAAILALVLAQIALGIWRPRILRRT